MGDMNPNENPPVRGLDPKAKLVADRAADVFWSAVADGFVARGIDSGDFPPEAEAKFQRACYEAVEMWLRVNERAEATCTMRVSMRPPKKGDRTWWVKARDAEDALAEVLRESEELGFPTQVDHDGTPDENGMVPVTITFERSS